MMYQTWWASIGTMVLPLLGCAPHPLSNGWAEPRPLGHDLPAYRAPEAPSNSDLSHPLFKEPTGVITLRTALVAAVESNPELAAFSWEVRVRDARVLQASLSANPEVGLEVEEIGGTGPTSQFNAVETTVLLSQLIPLAGKIEKRTHVAELDRNLAGWDYEAQRIKVFTNVTESFLGVAVVQRRLKLAREMATVAEQVFEVVAKRVKAGAATIIDQNKANIVVAKIRIELQRTQRELVASRHRLAATWASTEPAFESVNAELDIIQPIPKYEDVVARIFQNPQLARWVVKIAQSKAQIELAKAQSIPDVTVGAGVRRLNEPDDTVYLLEVSLPIPLFDRNQGGILEARYAAVKEEQERRAAQVQVRTILVQAYQTLALFYDEVRLLKDDVVPAARQAFDATNKAYQEGKIGFLEVLDAQRTLIETQAQYVGALGGYHVAVAQIEGLIGQRLNDFTDREPAVRKEASNGIVQD